jgi:hypothetical protein
VHRVHLSSMPPYLSSYLRFGPPSRHRSFTVPRLVPRTALFNDSTIYRGIRLWNYLPPIAKQIQSIFLFKREAERYRGVLVELSRPPTLILYPYTIDSRHVFCVSFCSAKHIVASGLELLNFKMNNFSGKAKNNLEHLFYNLNDIKVLFYVHLMSDGQSNDSIGEKIVKKL